MHILWVLLWSTAHTLSCTLSLISMYLQKDNEKDPNTYTYSTTYLTLDSPVPIEGGQKIVSHERPNILILYPYPITPPLSLLAHLLWNLLFWRSNYSDSHYQRFLGVSESFSLFHNFYFQSNTVTWYRCNRWVDNISKQPYYRCSFFTNYNLESWRTSYKFLAPGNREASVEKAFFEF